MEWALHGITDELLAVVNALGPPYSKLNAFRDQFVAAHEAVNDIRNFIIKMLECWREIAKLYTTCSPSRILGITVLKGVLDYFSSVRFGINFGIVIHGQFNLDLVPIRRAIAYIYNAICPVEIPGIGQAMTAFAQGQIDQSTYECWLRDHSADPGVWKPILLSQSSTLGPADIIELGLRREADEQTILDDLQARGWLRQYDRNGARELFARVPELPQWVHWWKADVLSDEAVGRYGLLDGFAEEFWPLAQRGTEIKGVSKLTAALEFAASYRLPGASIAKEMLYRLRPDKAGVSLPFTGEDYSFMLGFENWAPPARKWLEQVAYRVLDAGHLQSLYNWHLIDGERWQSGMKDIGYDAETTHLLYVFAQQARARDRAAAAHGWSISAVATAVRQGVVTPGEAEALLIDQGFLPNEIDRAIQVTQVQYLGRVADRAAQRARMKVQQGVISGYQTGTVDQGSASQALRAVGYSEASASAILSAVDLNVAASTAAKAVGALHHAYLRGEISIQQAGDLLSQAGIVDTRSQNYLSEWQIEFASRRPMLTTQNILKMVEEGLLPPDVAQTRLRNLGWQQPDLGLREAEVNLAMDKARAKMVAKAQKRMPESKMRKLFLQRLMDEAQIVPRLLHYGYDQTTIDYMLESWEMDRAKLEKPKPPKQPKPGMTPAQMLPLAELRKLFLDRLLGEQDVRDKLAEYGYDGPAIDLYIEQWTAQLAARDAKPKPPPPA